MTVRSFPRFGSRSLGFTCALALVLCGRPAAGETSGESPGEALLHRVSERFLAMTSFEAEFEQSQIWVGMESPQVSSGKLYLARPNRFRLEYSQPKGHLQVSDGERVWTYVPANGEVLLARLGDEAKGGDMLSRLLAESTPDPLVEIGSVGDTPARILTLRPDPSLGVVRLRVWTPIDSDAILQYEIEDGSGNVSAYRILKSRSNPRLDARLFDFEPPEGIPVVEVGAP